MSASATRQLRAWMADHEREMITLLGRIVDMDTSTLERVGVETLAVLVAERLRALGFAVERRDPAAPPHGWIADAFLAGRGAAAIAPAVVGRLGGGQGAGRLLLVAHLDTAFPPGAPAASPFRIANGRAYGPAVADMKGGVVGALYACRALLETGLARPETITVVFDSAARTRAGCSPRRAPPVGRGSPHA